MATAKRRVVPLALAISALGLVLLAQVAGASHPRPKGATPIRVPLVPAYAQCTASNRTHGPPLSFPSCNSPSQTSSYLTVGTPDANSAAANSSGFVRVTAIPGTPGPPDDTDILFAAEVTDVRCTGPTTTCGNVNATGGPDYTGALQTILVLRLTDHFNGVTGGSFSEPGTVIDVPFPVDMPCANTAATSTGGLCGINVSLDAITFPGIATNMSARRAVTEIAQIQVFDGGADGDVSTEGNSLFAVEGIFIP
jgi:hypothetical protein